MVHEHTGDRISAPKNNKRKVQHTMATLDVLEPTGGPQDHHKVLAPVVMVNPNNLDGGRPGKRARIATKVREKKESGVQLVPAKSRSKSVKEMISAMSARSKGNGVQSGAQDPTEAEGARSGDQGSGPEPNTPPENPQFHGEIIVVKETESGVSSIELGVTEGQTEVATEGRGSSRN